MRPALLLFALPLLGCPADEVVPVDPTPEPSYLSVALVDRPDVDAYGEATIADENLPGLFLGVAEGRTLVYLGGFGWEDIEASVPVDPRATLFRWASLSKGLTGVAALQTSLRGDVDLEAPVEDVVDEYTQPTTWLPEGCEAMGCAEPIPDGADGVTLRRLLDHTSGVQHYSNGLASPTPPAGERNDPAVNTGLSWALPRWIDAPLVAPPGTDYRYSTMGHNLAGVVLERASGRSFAELVDTWIADPLDMDTLGPDLHWEARERRAVGYGYDGGDFLPDGDSDVSWKLPGGGFLSTGEDLTRWCAGLLGDRLLPEEARDDVLWAPVAPANAYSFGFGVRGDTDRRVSHTGAQQKARTAVLVLPDQQRCFAVMTNGIDASPSELIGGLEAVWTAED